MHPWDDEMHDGLAEESGDAVANDLVSEGGASDDAGDVITLFVAKPFVVCGRLGQKGTRGTAARATRQYLVLHCRKHTST